MGEREGESGINQRGNFKETTIIIANG